MVKFEEALRQEIDNPKSKGFVSSTKISMNYKLISAIAPIKSFIFIEKYK